MRTSKLNNNKRPKMAASKPTLESDLTTEELDSLTTKGFIREDEPYLNGEAVADRDKDAGIVFCEKFKVSEIEALWLRT